MRLLYPLGLLGLLAIPVLILIYIIKSKYTEQVISSTYLWTLSERFLKRKNPIKTITGIVSLILQILAVVFISIALAHPVFTLKGRATDYCFILDGSGSMNVVQGDKTLFEEGKDRIRRLINTAADGSSFTLITTGNTTDVTVKQSEDKKATIRLLDMAEPSCVASGFDNAVLEAQKLFDDVPSCKFYLFTDKDFDSIQNIEHIKLAADGLNYGLSGVNYAFNADGGVTVSGKVYAYSDDRELDVDVTFDGEGAFSDTVKVAAKKNEGVSFSIDCDRSEFADVRVAIRQSDSLSLDNGVTLYHSRSDASYRTLIVSDEPLFLETAFASFGNIARDTVKPEEYNEDMRGYGLYVFDSCTPDKMPTDGAVWFINPDDGVEGAGFARRGTTKLPDATELTFSENSSSKVKKLLENIKPQDKIHLLDYVKCGLSRSFTTLITCNGDPVIFAGNNTYGNREVVIALNLHTSDFAMTYNGRVITYNLIGYTFPMLVDDSLLYCGESLSVNVLANCTGIRVESPSGKAEYLDTSEAISEYELTEVGEYKITATIGNAVQTARVFSQLPEEERLLGVKEASFIISGEASDVKRDGRYEDLLYAFIILAILIAADWGVYCYEQYQLR